MELKNRKICAKKHVLNSIFDSIWYIQEFLIPYVLFFSNSTQPKRLPKVNAALIWAITMQILYRKSWNIEYRQSLLLKYSDNFFIEMDMEIQMDLRITF